MNKYYYLCSVTAILQLMYAMDAKGQNTNHIDAVTLLDSAASRSVITRQYYDGLGRESVVGTGGVNMGGKYVYTMTEYDMQGRPSKSWLPTAGSIVLDTKTPAQMQTLSSSTYNDSHAFSETTYDALGRPVFTSTPGDAWHSSGKGMVTEYTTNVTGSVKRYIMTNTSTCAFTQQGFYEPATLAGEKTTDEDGKTIEIFKDLLGNTVLERRGGSNDTYFVYDKGLLCVVIPPLYQTAPNSSLLYKYRYDDRGRCIQKTLPGCSSISYEYDKYGRVAFMHDGCMSANTCRFYLYDGLGRLAVQGFCSGKTIGTGYSETATAVFGSGDREITGTGYYISSAYNLPNPTIETVNYYDSYDFLSLSSLQDSIGQADLGRTSHANATTLLTGRFQKTSDGHYLCSAIYYDQKGNVVETRENVMGGGIHSIQTVYTFTGQPSQVCESLTGKGVNRTTTQHNTYDAYTDMLLTQTYSYNSSNAAATASYDYDELGRIDSVSWHGGNISSTYDYDLHGWPTGIHYRDNAHSTALFDETLRYADGLSAQYYSGNISSVQVVTPDNPMGSGFYYGYNYYYDGLGRLTTADFGYGPIGTTYGSFTGFFSETMTYDANSNITSLLRNGVQNTGYYSPIDNLAYSYQGNLLYGITDQAPDLLTAGAFDFKDNTMSAGSAPEYGYNANGSLTYDTNKGISWIEYDQFGTPRRVQFANHSITEYVYAADGRRLKTRHHTSVPRSDMLGIGQTATLPASQTLSVDSTEYIGSYVCIGGQAKRYLFDGGYLQLYNSVAVPRYYAKDHLGSNRLVINSSGNIQQNNIFYPLGGTTALSSGQDYQQYKYTGKEYDPMHGLNQYDFMARDYDPAIGRFTTIDPMAEKYYHLTPYSYCGGDPVNAVDPDGRNPIYSIQGYFMGTDDYGLQGMYYVMDNSNFEQGMLHTVAESFDIAKDMNAWVIKRILRHYRTLPNRPDYDGFVTINEGIAWAKSHPNAIQHDNPDNALYIDASKLDFGSLSTSDFPITGIKKTQNLFNIENSIESLYNPTLRATVYALGLVEMKLIDREARQVEIISGETTDYDWNEGGKDWKRPIAIKLNNFIFGINPKKHGVKANYYGIGTLRK